ncbi:hypothetical protein V2W30_23380 [Streptomyces sp. Q6]|uniref:Uncharacterized protein n=1 Tax=Streptomyces citrinus TaxID=3118173 RepID=A0ACD5AFK9_9ACTN
MHGHGYAPPPQRLPSPGAQVGWRVLFVAIAVLTIGFLAFVPTLRLALTSHRKVDWRVFAAVAAAQFVSWICIFTDPGAEEFTTWRGNAGMVLMLSTLAVSVTYYLIVDIRLGGRARPLAAPYDPYGVTRPQQVYGYPQPRPQQPYAPPQPQPQQYTRPTPPQPHTLPTQTGGQAPTPTPAPQPQPQNQAQPPQRIDQVRAELDELSDYLRKQEGER